MTRLDPSAGPRRTFDGTRLGFTAPGSALGDASETDPWPRTLRRCVGVGLGLLVLLRTECLWYQSGGVVWIAYDVALLVLGVWTVGLLLESTVRGIRAARAHGAHVFIAPIVCTIVLADAVFNPLGVRLDCERFRSPVVARACYEGTMNQATLKLRENGRFEIRASSIVWADVRRGIWRRTADTLRLTYDRPVDGTKREEVFWITAGSYADPLLATVDTLWVTSTYRSRLGVTMEWYEGECQGTN